MARTGRPGGIWWWGARQRWAFSVGGRRHVAPRTIGEDDVRAAERWHAETLAREYPDRERPESPRAGRVVRKFRLHATSLKRLRWLVGTLRRERGRQLDSGRVLDILIAEAYAARRGKKPGDNPDQAVDTK